jgi:hypothetical protein
MPPEDLSCAMCGDLFGFRLGIRQGFLAQNG